MQHNLLFVPICHKFAYVHKLFFLCILFETVHVIFASCNHITLDSYGLFDNACNNTHSYSFIIVCSECFHFFWSYAWDIMMSKLKLYEKKPRFGDNYVVVRTCRGYYRWSLRYAFRVIGYFHGSVYFFQQARWMVFRGKGDENISMTLSLLCLSQPIPYCRRYHSI